MAASFQEAHSRGEAENGFVTQILSRTEEKVTLQGRSGVPPASKPEPGMDGTGAPISRPSRQPRAESAWTCRAALWGRASAEPHQALKASQGLIQPNLCFGRRWESKALFKQETLLLCLLIKIYTRSYAERLASGQQKIRFFFHTWYNLPYRHILGQKKFCLKGDGQSFLLSAL